MTNYTHFATELIFVVGVVGGDGWLEGHSFDTVTLYELYVYAEDPHIFVFFLFFSSVWMALNSTVESTACTG